MAPSFPHPNQGTVLWDMAHTPPGLRLRGFHPLWRAVPGHFGFAGEERRPAHNTTSPVSFPTGFGLDSSPFGRPYSGNPCWFLFLPLLGCFRSGGSRSLPGAPRAPEGTRGRRSHSGFPGSTAACAYPGPIAACRALLRRSSRAIHQTAWRVGP